MEIRAYDPADVARVAGLLPKWVEQEAVKYLERHYDRCELKFSACEGAEESWWPGLMRTYWGVEMRQLWSTHTQPLFTIKHDDYDPEYDLCGWCKKRAQHYCPDCNRPMTHMADDDCLYCWDEDLKAIANRPPEEDPKEW